MLTTEQSNLKDDPCGWCFSPLVYREAVTRNKNKVVCFSCGKESTEIHHIKKVYINMDDKDCEDAK